MMNLASLNDEQLTELISVIEAETPALEKQLADLKERKQTETNEQEVSYIKHDVEVIQETITSNQEKKRGAEGILSGKIPIV